MLPRLSTDSELQVLLEEEILKELLESQAGRHGRASKLDPFAGDLIRHRVGAFIHKEKDTRR